MATHASVRDAHDALIRDFPELAHDSNTCGMCLTPEKAEEAAVSDDRSYTAVEHAAILESEVARETADLRATKEDLEQETSALKEKATGLEAEKAELLNRIDKLEAEKAAAEAARDAAEKTHTDYVTEQERAAQLESLKVERAEAVKAALDGIDDTYFTDERVARWAEMSAEQFDAVLADLQETAGAFKKGKPADDEADENKEQARETSAFRGGAEPTGVDGPSTVGAVLSFGRSRPAATA